MKLFHRSIVRGAATYETAVIPIGAQGRLRSIACQDATTGFRAIPFYAGSQDAIVTSYLGRQPDLSTLHACVPSGGCVQGGVTSWLGWDGDLELGWDVQAVLVDISNCPQNDAVTVSVGVEQ